MLKIRLQRVGKRHEPVYRLVLTDSKNATRSGRFKEILGSYDPRKSDDKLNEERIKYWLSVGATPTATVNNLLVTHKVIKAPKINVTAKSKKEAKPTTDQTEETKETVDTKETVEKVSEETPAEPTEETKPQVPQVEESPIKDDKKDDKIEETAKTA